MPRVAVVTVLLCSYYFEFVVLFAYFLTRFCVVAVFQFLLGLCKPICYVYPCCQFFFSDDQSVTYIHVVNFFFFSDDQSVTYIHVVNFFFSDDQFTLQLSESEVEEEEDEGVPDLPGRYSLIIN